MSRRWIRGALANHKRGALHQSLGVPEGEVIPLALLHEAAEHPERFAGTSAGRILLARRARLAINLRRIGRKRRRR